jgi:hypothetical protein
MNDTDVIVLVRALLTIKDEAKLHQTIRGVLTRRQQGLVMGEWRALKDCSVLVNSLLPLLPGPHYMDLPDGGDVSVIEQLHRMAADAAQWRKAGADSQNARDTFEAQFERTIGYKPERYGSFNYERDNAKSLWMWWQWAWQAGVASVRKEKRGEDKQA